VRGADEDLMDPLRRISRRLDERMNNFADRLMDAIDAKRNPSCVGLDPRFDSIPERIKEECRREHGETFEGVGACLLEFNKAIIDAVEDIIPAVKPQMAFYECYGPAGVKAFADTVDHARKRGLLVIEDAKRNDIGTTAKAYSDGHLGTVSFWGERRACLDVDAVTVNPYLGSDGIKPFVDDCAEHGKGIFVLVKTSNPSSRELQDMLCISEHPALLDIQRDVGEAGRARLSDVTGLMSQADKTFVAPNYISMAARVAEWGAGVIGEREYSSVGAVVGATYPGEALAIRRTLPSAYFLVPGYGTQGGEAADAVNCFNLDGYGAVVSSSRGIIHAYQTEPFRSRFTEDDFDDAAKAAAESMMSELTGAMKAAGKYPW
jgi:orotidine-5'-phosphate decarboxylase